MATASPDTVDAIRLSARGLKSMVEEYERELILTALIEAGGHQRRAAASLGILPTTLCEKIKRLGLRQGSSDRSEG